MPKLKQTHDAQADIGFLTPNEAAEHLGIHRSAIYLAIDEGRLPTVRVLGKTALRRADVDAYQPRPNKLRKPVQAKGVEVTK